MCSSGPQGGQRRETDYLGQVWRFERTRLLQSQAWEPELRVPAWPSPMDRKAQVKINRKRTLHSPKLRWGERKPDCQEAGWAHAAATPPAGAPVFPVALPFSAAPAAASSRGQVVEESSGLVTRGPRQGRREPSRAAGRTLLLLRENYSLPV